MTSICSLQLPLRNIIQKVYNLGSKDAIVVLIELAAGQLSIHIKLQKIETCQYLCLDPTILKELTMELRKLFKSNIDYPCAHYSKRTISVKPIEHSNDYFIYMNDNHAKGIILNYSSICELLNIENNILNDIFNVEMKIMRKVNTHNQCTVTLFPE